jgi:tetratricopeptide (TPR) repeat protein
VAQYRCVTDAWTPRITIADTLGAVVANPLPPPRPSVPALVKAMSLRLIAVLPSDLVQILKLIGSIVRSILILLALYLVLEVVFSKDVEIAPIAVPATLRDDGHTPEVMALRLHDALLHINRHAGTTMDRQGVALAANRLDFILPEVGLSLRSVVQVLRQVLRVPAQQVTGEVTWSSDRLALRLRLGGGKPVTVTADASSAGIESLLQLGARELLLQASPYIVASYDLDHERDLAATLALAERIEREAAPGSETLARAVNLQGLIFGQMGDRDRQKDRLTRAIEVMPRLAVAHTNLGNLLVERRDFAGAIRSHQHAIRLEPSLAIAHNNLGAAYERNGCIPCAILNYERALALDPRLTVAWRNLGRALGIAGDFIEADEAFSEALRLEPRNASIWIEHGEILLRGSRDTQRHTRAERSIFNARAEQRYREAIRVDQTSAAAHGSLANVLWDQGRMSDAERSYREALLLAPRNALVHMNFARLLRDLQRHWDAALHARYAVFLEPTDDRRKFLREVEAEMPEDR